MQEKYKQLKDDAFEQFARIGKALSTAKRIEILELLSQGERTVDILAKEADLSNPNASKHLHILHDAGLVQAKKDGVRVVYSLADPAVGEFMRSLRLLAERQIAEVGVIRKRMHEGHEDMEPLTHDELGEMLEESNVTFLDVRPAEEYRAGHIVGAVSIPFAELEKRISELDPKDQIIAYCRGAYCALAIKAVELLRKNGYTAVHMVDGIQDWKSYDFPIQTGDRPF